jgi:2,4-dienoyl-CoA reductase-like NADH-dependent reductase (Old Yellow Enzyme family)/thioredoxin reductase
MSPDGSTNSDRLTTSEADALFAPLAVRGRTFANRIQFLSIATLLGPAESAAFAARRAAGGAGCIVSQAFLVDPTELPPGAPRVWAEEAIPMLRAYVAPINETGAVVLGQLQHAGRQHHSAYPPLRMAPSAIACENSGWVPHEMTVVEIAATIERYADAARNMRAAGFAGVEINASHGHLGQQFLSPLSNTRTDRYGASFDGRLQFMVELLDALRAAVGDDGIVAIRHCGDELLDGIGITPDLGVEIAAALDRRTSVDIISVSQANFMSKPDHVPDLQVPPMPYVELARRTSSAVNRAVVVATGRIRTPNEAAGLLMNGTAQIIGLGRALIADPDWPLKARTTTSLPIRRCLYCNMCWGNINQGRPVGCVHNPTAGRETLGPVTAANDPAAIKRITVVGGGPGGMSAAIAAAERGHHVTLLEAGDALGGAIEWHARVPGHEEFAAVGNYLRAAVASLPIDTRCNHVATAESVLQTSPDVVIVATGASPVRPPSLEHSMIPVRFTTDVIAEPDATTLARHTVIIEENAFAAGLLAAELLAPHRDRVTVVTRHPQAGRGLPEVSVTRWIGRLHAVGVRFITTSSIDSTRGSTVMLRHEYSKVVESIDDVDEIIIAGGARANNALAHTLHDALGDSSITQVAVIGDALAPRTLRWAIDEGHLIGRAL